MHLQPFLIPTCGAFVLVAWYIVHAFYALSIVGGTLIYPDITASEVPARSDLRERRI